MIIQGNIIELLTTIPEGKLDKNKQVQPTEASHFSEFFIKRI